MNLNDKSLKVIYNASAYKEEKDDKVRAFLRFIQTNEPGQDDFSNRLSALVEKIKDNDKFRRDYAAMNLHDRDITRAAKREGVLQGAGKAKLEVAENLLKMRLLNSEQIAQSVGISLEKVKELQSQLK
ncbi:MAG: hypothetical protein IJJ71_05365 [Treponema sp.]|uniref:hypothetical protein n=1 Tax=Treponema sp. TaxID=166 RepID=UPI0025FD8EFB|nr:hypothetical protein [Treponema sp.]MBR0495585.1 hypothetical protein [Treponema sp.]